MPTADVLATVKWNTLTYMYKRSLIKLGFKGYHSILPSTLAEELIIHGDRPSLRLKHGLVALSFSSKYVKNSISYRGAVPWNAIGWSNRSILECTDLKSFLKNVINCHTFKDFNFNVLDPQIINKRSENFIYFLGGSIGFLSKIPFNFERLELHHYQSNRKSNLSAGLEKDEIFKLGTLHQDLSSNEMKPCPILRKTE